MTRLTQADQLLRAILEDPDNDDRRLVYSDFLEETGGDAERLYADFIRVQVQLAQMNARHHHECTSTVKRGAESAPLKDRQKEIWGYWPHTSGVYYQFRDALRGDWAPLLGDYDPGQGLTYTYPWALVRRGFVGEVRTTGDHWLREAHTIMARHPVTAVRLTDREERFKTWERYSCVFHIGGLPDAFIDLVLKFTYRLGGGEWDGLYEINNNVYFRHVSDMEWVVSSACVLYGRIGAELVQVCRRCEGDGKAHGTDRPFEWGNAPNYTCPVCKGSGWVPIGG